jgi:hypothetical protein
MGFRGWSCMTRGYTSIGCEPCTAIPEAGADARSGRWGGKKLECGIHTFSEKLERGFRLSDTEASPMAERRRIVRQWREGDARRALVTLVRAEGSSYRRPGAHLLVGAEGAYAGSISGGCLEAEVVRKAEWMVRERARGGALFDDVRRHGGDSVSGWGAAGWWICSVRAGGDAGVPGHIWRRWRGRYRWDGTLGMSRWWRPGCLRMGVSWRVR